MERENPWNVRGAALSETVVITLLGAVFTIGLVSAVGDNLRALFATSDNSLAGVDSTPASRQTTADAYSLKGKRLALGATSNGWGSDQVAALNKAIREGSAIGDWEIDKARTRNRSEGFGWDGWQMIRASHTVGSVAAVDDVSALKHTLAEQLAALTDVQKTHEELSWKAFAMIEQIKTGEFQQMAFCGQFGSASKEACEAHFQALKETREELNSSAIFDLVEVLQDKEKELQLQRDATVAALRQKLGTDAPLPEYLTDKEHIENIAGLATEIYSALDRMRDLQRGNFSEFDFLKGSPEKERELKYILSLSWEEKDGDEFKAYMAGIRLRLLAEEEAALDEKTDGWLATIDDNLKRLESIEDGSAERLVEDLTKYRGELLNLRAGLPLEPCFIYCTQGENRDAWRLCEEVRTELEKLQWLQEGDYSPEDYRTEEDSDLPQDIYRLPGDEYDQAMIAMRQRFLLRETARLQKKANGWLAELDTHLGTTQAQDGVGARNLVGNIRHYRQQLQMVQKGQPLVPCTTNCAEGEQTQTPGE